MRILTRRTSASARRRSGYGASELLAHAAQRAVHGREPQRGATIVEFALVLPILIVILVGVIDFGFMVYDKAMVTNAAREGARAGIVLRNPRFTKAQVEAVASNFCQSRLVSLGGSNVCTVTADVPTEIKSQAGVPLTASAAELDKTLLKVTVEYEYEGPLETVIGVLSVIGVPGALDFGTMRSTAVMKYE